MTPPPPLEKKVSLTSSHFTCKLQLYIYKKKKNISLNAKLFPMNWRTLNIILTALQSTVVIHAIYKALLFKILTVKPTYNIGYCI